MICLLIANEVDLQEHKRDIKSPVICALHCSSFLDFQFTKDFFGNLGYLRKNPRSRRWGCTFLLTYMTPLGNSKIENQARPMEISHDFFFITPGNSTSFLVDPLEFPYALSPILLEILWIAHYGRQLRKFLNFSALGTYELL